MSFTVCRQHRALGLALVLSLGGQTHASSTCASSLPALRLALAQGGKFTLTRLGSDKLRIAGGGWSGTFLPSAK